MVARLRAVVRRASGYRVDAFRVQPFQVDDLYLDSEGWIVSVRDQQVALSAGEFAVLATLVLHDGRVVTPPKA
jgi:DNA-binding response OmpR family regulator